MNKDFPQTKEQEEIRIESNGYNEVEVTIKKAKGWGIFALAILILVFGGGSRC